MAVTYDAIATTTLGSAVSSYTFTSIPSTYTDLIIVASNGTTSGSGVMTFQINGDTATNYSTTSLEGNGTGAVSQRQSNQAQAYIVGFQAASYTSPYISIINFMNYANTSTYKTVISRSSSSAASAYVNLWRSTSAITSIQLTAPSTTFTAGSTFTLYGIL